MAVKIGSNISSLQAQRRLAECASDLSKVFERLSSGQRINRAADDAAGLAISSSLNADARVLNQAARNVNDTISMLSVAKGALTALSDITIRQKELAEQAANGSYSAEQRTAMNKEAGELTNEYNRIILNTKFNGRELFKSSWESLVTQAGTGNEGTLSLKIGDEMAAKIEPGSYFTTDLGGYNRTIWFTIDGRGSAPVVPSGTTMSLVSLYSNSQEQIVDLTIPQATGDLNGSFFYYYSPSGEGYYLWFNDGTAADPGPDWWLSETGIEVDTSGLSTREEFAAAVENALTGKGVSISNLGSGSLRLTSDRSFSAWDDFAYVGALCVQTAHEQAITPDEIAREVAKVFGAGAVAESGGVVTLTAQRTGYYQGAEDVNSNTWVQLVQAGSGPTHYSETWTKGMAFADVTGDGVTDMIGANWASYGLAVRPGVGDGTFGAGTRYTSVTNPQELLVEDVNGDGALDIVVTGGDLSVFLNKGDGTFQNRRTYAISAYSTTLSFADLDGDGDLDMVTGGSSGTTVLFNDGTGAFTSTILAGNVRGVATGDFDHDGRVDIATAGYNSSGPGVLTIWTNNGDHTFSAGPTVACGLGVLNLDAGDLNGDGWLDLIDRTQGVNTEVFRNNGNGTFADKVDYDMGGAGQYMELADLNGDGNLDMLTHLHATAYFSLRYGNGDGTFGAARTYLFNPTRVNFGGVAAGDIDGDGDMDIGAADDAGFHFLLNQGGGNFTDPNGDRKQVMRLTFGDARGRTLIEQVDLTTVEKARKAMPALDTRLRRLGQEIGMLGANESRHESALGVLESMRENKTAAAARITDADVAEEAAALVKKSILQQATSAVLAQANQQPSLALQLLKVA